MSSRTYGPYDSVKSQYRKKKMVRIVKRGNDSYMRVKLEDALFIVERLRPYGLP